MSIKTKNLLFAGLFYTALLSGITLSSCKKDPGIKNTTNDLQGTTRAVQPGGTIVMGSSCGENVQCDNFSTGMNVPRYNMMTFTKNAATIVDHPTLRYTIYKYSSGPVAGVTTYTRIAEFTCSTNSVHYANSLITNSTSFYLTLSSPTGSATPLTATYSLSAGFSIGNAFAFTSGNIQGYCGTPPSES